MRWLNGLEAAQTRTDTQRALVNVHFGTCYTSAHKSMKYHSTSSCIREGGLPRKWGSAVEPAVHYGRVLARARGRAMFAQMVPHIQQIKQPVW